MAKNPLKITSTTLRDAHQSLLATRMHTDDMLEVCETIDKMGYYSVEMWGGATFDATLRFTGEDPWERITTLKKYIKNTPFQMLLRGQNCVGYRHYADDVVEAFVAKSAERGIDIFRIFDALNDLRNIEFAVKQVKKNGKIAEGCVSYTTSHLHTIDLYVKQAKQIEDMGCDLVCIKDMAGLLEPYTAYELVKKMKEAVKIPIHLHCHTTSGMSPATYVKAAEAGVDIVDCAISTLSMGTSQPAIETMVVMMRGTDRDTGIDLEKLAPIAMHMKEVRADKYSAYEANFSGVDARVLSAQVPGGMLSNMYNQLKDYNALDKYDEVMEEIPRVRKDFGYPPLVTPSSQIVGVQAVMNVLAGERYKNITKESKEYLKGMYGRPIGEVNEELRKKALGDEKPITCRPADLLEPELPKLEKENIPFLKTLEDKLSYILHPKPALEFFKAREKGELHLYKEKLHKKLEKEIQAPASKTSQRQSSTAKGGVACYKVVLEGKTFQVQVMDSEIESIVVKKDIEVNDANYEVKADLPGSIIEIHVQEGDEVQEGENLMVIESMKMMNNIICPANGTIVSIKVNAGDNVQIGSVLLTLKTDD